MVSDRIFYPLIALLFAGMIWAALAYGPTNTDPEGPFSGDAMDGFLINGKYMDMMQNGPGLTHELTETPEGETVVRAFAGAQFKDAPSAGVFLTVPPRFLKAWEGHKIQIAVYLRQPHEQPSENVILRYYATRGKNSKPTTCTVSTEWRECLLMYKIPLRKTSSGLQFIGIWPDTKGLGRGIEIRSIQVRVMDRHPS